MRVTFAVGLAEADRVRQFYSEHRDSPFVAMRARRNVNGDRPPLTRPAIWHALVTCLLTTQQRSGPQSAVMRFLRRRPFPLDYASCQVEGDVSAYVRGAITAAGGIRRGVSIGTSCATNLARLEGDGGWRVVVDTLRPLERAHDPSAERVAANVLADSLRGIGPKQSRNLLQLLGLTQHEVPIDSRVTKWLMEFGFPIQLSAASLSDRGVYELVSDGFQALCAAAGIVPCLVDAAIFASYDEPWGEDDMFW